MSCHTSDDLIKVFPLLFCNKHEINLLIDPGFNLLAITEPSISFYEEVEGITPKDLVGKSLYDEFFQKYNIYKEDLDFILHKLSTRENFQYIGVNFSRNVARRTLFFEYNKVMDGSLIHCRGYVPKQPLNWYHLQHLQHMIIGVTKDEDNSSTIMTDKYGLTPREQEVLFLIFHFHSYEEIASVINLYYEQKTTANAIGKLVRRSLYEKLNVLNLPSLKQKAYELKYHVNVPKSLLPEILIEIPD